MGSAYLLSIASSRFQVAVLSAWRGVGRPFADMGKASTAPAADEASSAPLCRLWATELAVIGNTRDRDVLHWLPQKRVSQLVGGIADGVLAFQGRGWGVGRCRDMPGGRWSRRTTSCPTDSGSRARRAVRQTIAAAARAHRLAGAPSPSS
jgi:hypothetical protein